MFSFIKFGSTAAAALTFVAATAVPSHAFHAGVFDKAELKCRSSVSKSLSKAIQIGQKTIALCHKDRAKAGGTADCNVLDSVNADSKGKFDKAKQKIVSSIQTACTDANIGLDVLTEYISCPEPCTTTLGLDNPLSTYAELGQCLACVATEVAQEFGNETQGLPSSVPLSKEDQTCHAAIGKEYGKYLWTVLKVRTKCQNTAEKKDGATHLNDTGCLTYDDTKAKIAGALTTANAGISESCSAANLGNLDSCSSMDVSSLQGCLEAAADTAGDAGVQYSYELPATICPIALDGLVRGSKTHEGESTETSLELGWTGLAHLADLQDNYLISVDLSCPSGTPPCGTCSVDGVSATGPQYESFLRCADDFTISCDAPFGNDAACPGGGACAYIVGPPLPVSAGASPVCSINVLRDDIAGTSNPDTGEGELNIPLLSNVHLGESIIMPCPVCVGDLTPFDGIKAGHCQGGNSYARNGDPCDTQGYSASFAAEADDKGLSLDCPPPSGAFIGGLKIGLGLTTGTTSLGFENDCGGSLSGVDCACGQCSGDSSLPCTNNTDCSNAGAGACTSIGSQGVQRQPNDCGDLTCSPSGLGDDKGTCLAGPQDKFCDAVLDANGNGYIFCNDDSQCDFYSSTGVCGAGGCGECGAQRQRGCFLDPIVKEGTPSTENPILVGTFCLSPTTNNAINGVSGTPGPARVTVDQLVRLRY